MRRKLRESSVDVRAWKTGWIDRVGKIAYNNYNNINRTVLKTCKNRGGVTNNKALWALSVNTDRIDLQNE